MDYKIRTLIAGWLYLGEKEPVHAWYIEGNGIKVLVDAGMPESKIVEKRWKTKAEGGGEDAIINELKKHGVMPSEIDIVILTHMHFDHAWNLDLFPNAQIIIQKEEVIHAIKPVPIQRSYYNKELNVKLISRNQPKNLLIIEGDYLLKDGLEIVFTPGHTPGSLSVIVNTEKGKVGLCSDLGPRYQNWFPADSEISNNPKRFLEGSYLPNTIHTENVMNYINTMEKFMKSVDIVIPAHDDRIPVHMPEQWWGKPSMSKDPLEVFALKEE
ncbi:glyoxylase-like metal-dependent hydrolase (beta-lactamase superfamily II) [Neobacillus niacini]|uniref:N-acyl homoserine lactonase family protein n=1 Tax=Neobacillus niacini TaxID=86668 RepID=UPI00286129A1|nr:N-acyl homoserine lactonase family protein [Neobacillus niacini]MDR7076066.1 glyoxylase-like metal-dependent hydrolase (beta-lactamase superfamily II) [Neobacillus niacini]